ncbi:hypothetical protein RKE29_12330 [Streptomyces sp. B1866]|uniref:hypothetical protein n=1 Tax=Streptomyces sp. B1866 TaxID=3075431 RepID=UPI00289039DF|nr:hypothetical protein [Streptomyces sp. B1866]MDT3397426.1 hypothetical protein [Streptomyces sp. B1866]
MAYKVLGGAELSTGWADNARVEVLTYAGGNNSTVIIEYTRGAKPKGTVRLRFEQVMSFEWTGSDYECLMPDSDDFEFGLIEVFDSQKLRTLAEKARLPGVVLTDSKVEYQGRVVLHHYRLGFDDHGTYDLVCGRPVEITHLYRET